MKLNEFRAELERSPDYIDARNDLKFKLDLAGAVIKSRTKKGWSQEQLAERIGTKQANISRIESGLSNPTISVVEKLAKVLEFSIEIVDEKFSDTKFISNPLTLDTLQTHDFSYLKPTPISCADYDWRQRKSIVEEKVFA